MNGVKDLTGKRSNNVSASSKNVAATDIGSTSKVRKTLDMRYASMMNSLDAIRETIQEHKSKISNLETEKDGGAELFTLSNAIIRMQRDYDFLNNNAQTADIMFRYFSVLSPQDSSSNDSKLVVTENHPETSILRFFSSPSTTNVEPSPTKPTVPDRNVMDKSKMLQEFMHITVNRSPVQHHVCNDADPDSASDAILVAGMSANRCTFCGSDDVSVHPQEGIGSCNQCGTTEFIVVDSDKPSFKDQPKEIHYWSYKRVNHLNECLNQMQGKETTEISDVLMERIQAELKKRRITNVANVNITLLRSILKKLNESKYYEHLPSILQRLNGTKLPYLPPELERRIKSMFSSMQLPYIKHAPAGRTNFMSYNFCVYKCLQLLGHDEYLEQNNSHFIKLLKSREKLQEQDKVWSKICNELGWVALPSM